MQDQGMRCVNPAHRLLGTEVSTEHSPSHRDDYRPFEAHGEKWMRKEPRGVARVHVAGKRVVQRGREGHRPARVDFDHGHFRAGADQ